MAEAIAVIYCFQLLFYLSLIAPRMRSNSRNADTISVETELRRDQEAEVYSETRPAEAAERMLHLAWIMFGFIFSLLICIHELFDDFPAWSICAFGLLAALGVLLLWLLRVNRENVEEVSIDPEHRERIAPELEKIAGIRRSLFACFNGWMAGMGISILWLLRLTASTPRGLWEAAKDLAKRAW